MWRASHIHTPAACLFFPPRPLPAALAPSDTVFRPPARSASSLSIVRHHKRLLAFGKTDDVAPGASVDLVLTASLEALASYDPGERMLVVEAGAYTIDVGPDSITVSGSARVTVAGRSFPS